MWWDICISSLKMSFHYDRYWQILIEINEHMILIEIIQGLKEIPNSLTFFYWYFPQYMIILQINHFQLQVGWKVFNWINIFWNMKFSFAFLLRSGKKLLELWFELRKYICCKLEWEGWWCSHFIPYLWEYSKYIEQFNITGGLNNISFHLNVNIVYISHISTFLPCKFRLNAFKEHYQECELPRWCL